MTCNNMWHQLITTSRTTDIAARPAANGDDAGADYDGAERRSKPRLKGSFPTVARGVDATGETFQIDATIDNISAGGLYLRLRQRLEPGMALFFVTSLSTPGRVNASAPRLALHGVVLRAELTHGGACGVAVALTNYRFLGAE